jgi:hypothetical protein
VIRAVDWVGRRWLGIGIGIRIGIGIGTGIDQGGADDAWIEAWIEAIGGTHGLLGLDGVGLSGHWGRGLDLLLDDRHGGRTVELWWLGTEAVNRQRYRQRHTGSGWD